MNGQKRILIVGSGKWQVPLFTKAKELGLFVVGTDIYSDAPGFQYCDASALVDVRNISETLKVAEQFQVDAVVTGVDLAVPTTAAIAERLDLPGISSETARIVTNKATMRQKVESTGLAGPQFTVTENLTQARTAIATIGFPCVMKPTDNCGSRGVTVISSIQELENAYQNALAAAFSKKVLIEEFMTGQESSVEGWIDDSGKLQILGISEKIKSHLPYRYDLQLNYPANFSDSQLQAIETYVRSLVRGVGLKQGLVHIELMITEEKVRLIEMAARGCGAFVIGKLMPATTETDPLSNCIRQALGEVSELGSIQKRHGILKFILGPPGKLTDIQGLEAARKVPGIVDLGLDVHIGQMISSPTDTTGRLGYLLAVGNYREEVDEIAEKALKLLHFTTI